MASLKNTRVFTPRSISGLQLWLDAADSSSYTVTATKVIQWNDKSGNSYHMTPVGTQSNGTISSSFQNSLNVVNFSGRNMYRTAINSAVYPSDCFLVLATKDLARADFFSFGNTTSDNFNSLTLGEYTPLRWHNGSSTFSRTPNTVSPVNETSTGFLIMQWSLANNNYILRRNGSLLTQTASYTYTIGGNPVYQIGYRHTDQTTSLLDLNAYFAEVLVFNSQLSTSQREQIEGYLAWKWGLQANLPSSHPFKNGLVPFSYSLVPTRTRFTPIFDPRSISGLQLWLDAATSFPTFTNGQAITRWVDKTSNGWVGTAVNSPTYQTNVQNGLPVIRFNGTNQYINFGNILNLGTNALTLFIVTKYAINAGNQVGMVGKSSYRGNPGRWAIGYDTVAAGPNGIGVYNFVEDTNQSLTAFAHNPNLGFGIYCGQNNRTSSNTIYLNGQLRGQQTFSASANNLSNTDPLYVASYPNNTGTEPQAGQFMNGDIGEILVYFSNLTTAQRQQVEGYLARKWGVSLVSTHPNANTLTIAPFSHTISRIPFAPTAKWRPTQISGCALWLDAADPSRFTVSGTTITQWRDKIASRNFNGTATLASSNSLPCVRLNGSQKLTSTTNFTFAEVCTNSANMTCFLVLNVSSTTNVNSSAFSLNEAQPRFIPFYNGSGGVFFDAGQQANPRLSGSFTNNTRQIHVFLRTNVLTLQFRVNGTQNASNRFASPANFGNQTYSVNIAPTGAGGSWIGDIHEILYFSNEIGIANIQLVEGYLAWKWRLQANLPASHPYAKFPPTP